MRRLQVEEPDTFPSLRHRSIPSASSANHDAIAELEADKDTNPTVLKKEGHEDEEEVLGSVECIFHKQDCNCNS